MFGLGNASDGLEKPFYMGGFQLSRFDYVKYDKEHEELQASYKDAVIEMERAILSMGQSREASLAITKLEECYMWVGKAIRNHQIKVNGPAELLEERKEG